ncbi:MAG: hypothetical protein DRN81_03310, partial [Thermoproteota archaeon]
PPEWPPYAMAQDLYPNAFDTIPYKLDQKKDKIYYNYQEDEAGLNYSWMSIGSPIRLLEKDKRRSFRFFLWTGTDNFYSGYGRKSVREYEFGVIKFLKRLRSKRSEASSCY